MRPTNSPVVGTGGPFRNGNGDGHRYGAQINGVEPDAGIQHGPIQLTDHVGNAFVSDRRERATGGDQRAPRSRQSSAGAASANGAELERGKMIGRSVCHAISRIITSVNAPAQPDAPISIVGRT